MTDAIPSTRKHATMRSFECRTGIWSNWGECFFDCYGTAGLTNNNTCSHMIGTEYIVLHVQEPILYVIRKQHRSSPTQTTPLADYYILAGFVYQAPDLQSVVNSRFTTCVHHLTSAFDETISYMKYHPTKGYSWDFGKDSAASSSDKTKDKDRAKDKLMRGDFGSTFQRRRVDLLLAELSKKFPHKNQAAAADVKADAAIEPGGKVAAAADGTAVRSEKQGDVTNVQSAAGLKRTSDAVGPLSKAMRSN